GQASLDRRGALRSARRSGGELRPRRAEPGASAERVHGAPAAGRRLRDPAQVLERPSAALLAMAARPQLAPPQTALERLPEEWAERLAEWGEPRYRALQVFRWIHQRGVTDPARMSDLPKALRERLAAELQAPLAVSEVRASIDGTHKLVLELH